MNTEVTEVQGRNKAAAAAKTVAAIALAGCLVGSLGLNIYQASVQNQKVNQFIDNQLERQAKENEQENTYQEDGFLVMDEYEIRSTTHISDAYQIGDSSQLSEADKDTLEMASAILDEVIQEGMGNYEKELAVYDWMVANIGHGSGGTVSRPGTRQSPFTPHDVLTSRQAVCVGYATTFRLFMNMLGMDCHIVHNDYHSWDLVELEEGQWYHVDVYSDVHGVPYRNFNMTDQICQDSHTWDGSALPEASSVKYSYAVQSSVELEDIYAIPAAMKAGIDAGTSAMFFRFPTPLTDQDLNVVDLLVSLLRNVIDYTPETASYYFYASWYQDDEQNYILGLFLEGMDYEESEDFVTTETPEGQKVLEAIQEAFGVDPENMDPPWENDDPWDEPAEVAVPDATDTSQPVAAADGGWVVIDD